LNKVGRALWAWAWLILFRLSPRSAFMWRRCLLRAFGASIATGVKVYPDARIYAPWNLQMERDSIMGDGVNCYNVDRVVFEAESNVTHYTFVCTAGHDIDSGCRKLITRPIRFGIGSWVFGHAIILPGVTVGRGGVVAAGSVVSRNVGDYAVVAGNPARKIRDRTQIDRQPES